MRRTGTWPRLPLFLALLAGLAPAARADDAGPSRARLGERIGDFALRDAGKPLALSDLKDKKAVVVVFLSFDCPVAAAYAQTLADLARAHPDAAFLGVSVGDEDAARVAKLARDAGLPFPVCRDERRAAVTALAAEVTPEAFVLDAGLVLRYRGRIDDRYAARLKPNAQISRHDLRQALEEVLAGKAVSVPATQAVGCAVPGARPAPPPTAKVTYFRDVLPILQNHCQECHRPGEVGPFALMTYRQAVNWAADIKEYTASRKMPPWKPVDGVPMHGERRLSPRDIATLAAWADGGTPEGDPATAPPPRRFTEGWQLGTPDLVLNVEEDFTLGAEGSDLYRCFVLPTGLTEDRSVVAAEVRPGNRRVVHHAVLFVDTSGMGRELEAKARARKPGPDSGPGYSLPLSLSFFPGFLPRGGLGGWVPGLQIRPLPDGTGLSLPRGADVIMQLHYHRSGRAEKDRTSVGLYFAKTPAERHIQGLVVPGHFLMIPPGAERYTVGGSMWVRRDCHLHALAPHMHLLGREIKVTMVPPDGPPRVLIDIKDWDFNWQEEYRLKEPLAVKAGTRFDIESVFDNSSGNPRNPHKPPKMVFFGLETNDEMSLAVLAVTGDKPGRVRYDVQPRIQGVDWSPKWGIPLLGF
jgi:peroxiredoxin